jgi:hypothetical protein
MFKVFLKLLGVTRTRIRILGSGSVKKNSSKQKMQMIPDPDVVRIRESYQAKRKCNWLRILESGFRNFYADPRFASIRTMRYGSPPPDPIGLGLLMICKGTRHLDHQQGTGNALPCSRTNAIQVRQAPNPPSLPCLPGLPNTFTITILR